ncbi:MAG: carbon monoxide dehydrogenase subunit G [Candidatus Brocadiae bacterium]|nr:carbon monoxide dehydrogenase subunit G [Candidatus Brocadiia bacterium]
MLLESEFIFNGPREKVWEILQDPDILILAVPGTKSLKKLAEGEFEGEMNVKIGPLNGTFLGNVVLSNQVPPASYTIVVDAKGPLGFGKGSGTVELTAQSPETTLMKYSIDLEVGGKLAGVGQRLLETVGTSISRQSLAALNQALVARLSGKPLQKPSSQTKFAMGVSAELCKRMLCSKMFWAIVAGLAGIVGLYMYFFHNCPCCPCGQ